MRNRRKTHVFFRKAGHGDCGRAHLCADRSPLAAAADALADARDALIDAQIAFLKTKPTTVAGAVALLETIAEFEETDPDDASEFYKTPGAIRNALAVLRKGPNA